MAAVVVKESPADPVAAASAFQEILTAPEEFFQSDRFRDFEGERRLFLAVMEDAVRSLLKYVPRRTLLSPPGKGTVAYNAIEDLRWMRSDDEKEPCSFLNLCEAIGLDPSACRRELEGIVAARKREALGGKKQERPKPTRRRAKAGSRIKIG